jgi:hypothetical protein
VTSAGLGAIRQNAYVVADLDAAVAAWLPYGVGPWFVMPEMEQTGSFLGDEPIAPVVTLAFANSGPLQIELIVQHDGGPSAFSRRPPHDPSGYHHLAFWVADFDAAEQELVARGAERVSHGDGGGAARWGYYDAGGRHAPLLELMELNDTTTWMTTKVRDAHETWDGVTDPVRRLF